MAINLADDAFIDLDDFAINATWTVAASSDKYVVTVYSPMNIIQLWMTTEFQ